MNFDLYNFNIDNCYCKVIVRCFNAFFYDFFIFFELIS